MVGVFFVRMFNSDSHKRHTYLTLRKPQNQINVPHWSTRRHLTWSRHSIQCPFSSREILKVARHASRTKSSEILFTRFNRAFMSTRVYAHQRRSGEGGGGAMVLLLEGRCRAGLKVNICIKLKKTWSTFNKAPASVWDFSGYHRY